MNVFNAHKIMIMYDYENDTNLIIFEKRYNIMSAQLVIEISMKIKN